MMAASQIATLSLSLSFVPSRLHKRHARQNGRKGPLPLRQFILNSNHSKACARGAGHAAPTKAFDSQSHRVYRVLRYVIHNSGSDDYFRIFLCENQFCPLIDQEPFRVKPIFQTCCLDCRSRTTTAPRRRWQINLMTCIASQRDLRRPSEWH